MRQGSVLSRGPIIFRRMDYDFDLTFTVDTDLSEATVWLTAVGKRDGEVKYEGFCDITNPPEGQFKFTITNPVEVEMEVEIQIRNGDVMTAIGFGIEVINNEQTTPRPTNIEEFGLFEQEYYESLVE